MKIKLLICLLFSCLLTGCVAAVVSQDYHTAVNLERDARIFHIVHTTIVTDPRFRGSRIGVSCFNQDVLLVGQTPIASLRVIAEKIAQGTDNVRRVYNQVVIAAPISLKEQSNDAWITSQVRARMLAEKGLESGFIRVVTEDRVVYLMGVVTPDQAALAVNVARQISGVRKVVKIFTDKA